MACCCCCVGVGVLSLGFSPTGKLHGCVFQHLQLLPGPPNTHPPPPPAVPQGDMKDKWRNLIKQNRIQPHEITEIEASRLLAHSRQWAECMGAAAGRRG